MELTENLTVISTDTLYFDNENMNEDRPLRVGQLEWLENLFANSSDDMKFILTDHIYETGAFAGPTTKKTTASTTIGMKTQLYALTTA